MQQHHSNHNTAVSKIVWPKNWTDAHANDGTLPIFLYSVDGVHCRVNEPFHPTLSKNTKMYSHKFNQAGFGYELAISVYHNALVWMNGPFMGSKHDVRIFKEEGLKEKTPTGKRGIADNGYKGARKILSTPNSHDPPELRKFKVSCFLLVPPYCLLSETCRSICLHHLLADRDVLEPDMKHSMEESRILPVSTIDFDMAWTSTRFALKRFA